MRAVIEGTFLSAELEPWSFKDEATGQDRSGSSWSINLLGDDDQTVRLSAKEEVFKKDDFPERNTAVAVSVEFFPTRDDRGRVAFRAPKALSIRTGSAFEDTPASKRGGGSAT